jgi:cation diffusion facilitator CzcD-associated flavoprotein CzcO
MSGQRVRVAIVGSGFSGLGMAVRLKQEGIDDFVVLERAHDVGGTWRENTYPGCQCDVPSHLYSLSFAPNPDWSRTYSRQAEIWDYLRKVVADNALERHLRFGHDVTEAAWDEDTRTWHVETTAGAFEADVLVGAMGPLTEPSIPDIPGLDSFDGAVFHSAQWDHEHDLTGERVAVIGTGASAIQFVPRIQPKVAKLHLFQRTPPWVLPHTDRPVSPVERRLYRALPPAQRLVRAGIYWAREMLVFGFARDQRLMAVPEALGRRHLKRQVRDPELRRKLKPRYRVGCKRILISNEYYPALTKPNVEVVTDGVREVRPHSIVAADGTERVLDAIILGTGFHVTDSPAAQHVRGRDGRTLAEAWQGSPEAYLGTAIAGFPNLFMIIGPNTGLGHNSMVFMIESHLSYVIDALKTMDERDVATVEVRPEVQRAFVREVGERMEGTVWTSGCSSWYIDATGRNSTLWPDFTWRFRQRTRRFDPTDYVLHARSEAPAAPVPA